VNKFPSIKALFLSLLVATSGFAQQPGSVRWKISLTSPQSGTTIVSSPAIAPNGTIYIGTGLSGMPQSGSTNNLYSVSPAGATNWIRPLGAQPYSTPAIAPDGTIYIATHSQLPFITGRLDSMSPTGRTNWSFQASGVYVSSPALGVDGTIYIVSLVTSSTMLYSVRPNGATNWLCSLGPVATTNVISAQFPSPTIGPDGTIYIGSLDTNVYAISPQGKTNWMFRMQDKTFSSPAIGRDGTIYIGSDDHRIYALDPRGAKKWDYVTTGVVESTPAIGSDGSLYVGSLSRPGLSLLSPAGILLKTNSATFCSASPAIGADGTVYCVDYDTLRAWNSAGSNIWSVLINATYLGFSSPAIGPDGTIYVAGGTNLWAIYGSSPPAESASPMFRRNALRTSH
jgi:outer membrane protein assembly factor BamB